MKVVLVAYCVPLLAGCTAKPAAKSPPAAVAPRSIRPALLHTRLKSLVTDPFLDCGHATHVSASKVVSCTERALTGRSPFIASFEQQGIDSDVVLGLASSAPGEVVIVTWDGDPSGGMKVGAEILGVRTCREPHFTPGAWFVRVECQ